MKNFILALDEGTTAATALVVGTDAKVLGKASFEIPQIYPRAGEVEHDPETIWKAIVQAAVKAMEEAGVEGRNCLGIGITNQRETTIIWDRKDGVPVYNAIVWQCRRTSDICRLLKEQGLEPLYRERTGLVLDPYFSGTKVKWLLDNCPGLKTKAQKGEVCFGTVDSYLLYRLTNGRVHATDVSNASRTLMMDLRTLQWEDDLLAPLDIPKAILPEIRPSACEFGRTEGLSFLPDGVPIGGIAGDQQAALFGQGCFEQGQAKCTYGTGAFLLANTGPKPVSSSHGLLTTVAWKIGDVTHYALEGSAFIAGAAVQWLRDGLGLIRTAAEVEPLAARVEDSGGVVFVAALAGLGAPHWQPNARGAFFGLTRGTTSAHLARAVLEGIAFQVADLAHSMANDLGYPLKEIRVDGGASANDLLMQFQSDITGLRVLRPSNLDTTALGAAYLAGIGVGLWDMAWLAKVSEAQTRFEPKLEVEERLRLMDRYHKAVRLVTEFGLG